MEKTNVDKYLEDLADSIANYAKSQMQEAAFVERFRKPLEELGFAFRISSYSGIAFYSLPHEDCVKVFKAFPGRWDKEYANDSVTYTNKEHDPKITLDYAKPPDNCKIVEYEEKVPEQVVAAHTITKRKIECKKAEDFPVETQEVLDAAIPTE